MHEDNATGYARAQTPDDDLSQSLLRQPPPELFPQPPLRFDTARTSTPSSTQLVSAGATGGFGPN